MITTPSGLRMRRISHALGMEVHGVDFTRPLPAAVLADLRAAYARHMVLVFPEADMSIEEHVAFSKQFGPLELHPLKALRHPVYPEAFEITNRKKADGAPSETGEIGRLWHSDGAYTVRPPTGSLLHCHALPEAGGTTWFANTAVAYETLSPGMQRLVNDYEVINDLLEGDNVTPWIKDRDAAKKAQERKDLPKVIQPMVRVHPVTGRKALYINPAVTRQIVDMTIAESRGILEHLFKHMLQPEFMYCHYWKVHDLVMWDNRSTMHLAPSDYPKDEVRAMVRCTLMGEPHGRLLNPEDGVEVTAANAAAPVM